MFAQLLITLTLTWILAEALCRLLLQGSLVSVVREMLTAVAGPLPDGAEPAPETPRPTSPRQDLRQRLGARQRELAELRQRLEASQRSAAIVQQLEATEAEMRTVEDELAELAGRHPVATPP